METIIGFIAGYLTGVSEGRGGLDRARKSLEAIRTSPEFRRILSEAVTVAQGAVGRVSKGGLSAALGGVSEVIGTKAAAPRDRRAA